MTNSNSVTINETQLYLNKCGIIVFSSETILQKIEGSEPLFFTIEVENLKEILSKAIEKDSGHTFENCNAFFIPNSYIEFHVNQNISLLDKLVTLQVRRRKDSRGLNFFFSKTHLIEATHKVSLNDFEEKKSYFNEIHFKTKNYDEQLTLSISH